MLRLLSSKHPVVCELLNKKLQILREVEDVVSQVLAAVKNSGDAALFQYTLEFDGVGLNRDNLRVSQEEIKEAYQKVEPDFLTSLNSAKENIIAYHRRQSQNNWLQPDAAGNIVGLFYRPLRRVGIYVPGGTAAYPSSVLMNALPAAVAGVPEIVMVTPPQKDSTVNPYVLVAADLAGVTEIYKVGGAQAIGALAYGTELVQKADKIVGPGNIYVTAAKKMVFGDVDIDMLAGPSEIMILADDTANPAWLAADLLSQAEHDPLASSILCTPDANLAQKVQQEVSRQLTLLPRQQIARASLEQNGGIIITADLAEAMDLANKFAPEHLELALAEPWEWLGKVQNAGTVFLGHYTPEPVGDYYAGTNHVLPTGGTSRFFSPLGVETFMKRMSLVSYTKEGLEAALPHIKCLARVEGLEAHANAVKVRFKQLNSRLAREEWNCLGRH
ncbi:MAG: histidinol dehydrogenase [Bacillota bacterium]